MPVEKIKYDALPADVEASLSKFYGPLMARKKALTDENKQLQAGIRSLNSNIEHRIALGSSMKSGDAK